ncbi:MAG: hypothetical protein ABFD90_05595 [Phycisphaerales bacterium]
MKLSRRRVIAGVVALVLVLLAARAILPSVLFLAGVVVFTRKWAKQAAQARNHLFLETDYQELLAACRSLSGRTVTDESGTRWHFNVHFGKRDPETLSFPQVILDLKPSCVYTDWHGDGEVIIELFPGPEWVGVTAFPEGSEGHGCVKLIEGLWYFDPSYRQDRPRYVARINDMVEEGRRLRANRVAAQETAEPKP